MKAKRKRIRNENTKLDWSNGFKTFKNNYANDDFSRKENKKNKNEYQMEKLYHQQTTETKQQNTTQHITDSCARVNG